LDSIWDLFKPEELIRFGGLALLLIIIFLENGVFFGFFLPGDSLLFTAGLLAYPEVGVLDVSLEHLILYIGLAAIGGYYAGYFFGYKTGEALYKRKDTLFFKKEYITTAEVFYKKYGGVALVLGRFLPIVRTFAPILAGVVKVRPIVFFMFNVVGAFLWPLSIVSAGYYVGKIFPNALDYLNYIIIGFIVVTSIPVINSIRNDRKLKKAQ
jgi:membrane-associated protein